MFPLRHVVFALRIGLHFYKHFFFSGKAGDPGIFNIYNPNMEEIGISYQIQSCAGHYGAAGKNGKPGKGKTAD